MFLVTLNDVMTWIMDKLSGTGMTLLKGVLTIVIGYFVIKIIKSLLKRILYRSPLDNTICTFLLSIFSAVLYILYLIVIAASFNISTTNIAAIVAASSVAIGLALKDSLSNIANGLLLVVNKPFREGDYVNIGGTEGTVYAIHMVTTVLITPDNKKITIPNNTVTSSNVINYNGRTTRRLEILFTASYNCDVELVKKTIKDVAVKHKYVLKNPAPTVRLDSQADSALVYTCRVWVNCENYWDVKWDLNEQMIEAFKDKNIDIPFNQLDVRVKKEKA